MRRILFAFTIGFVLGCQPLEAGPPPAEPIRMNPAGVGLDGYSPVAYFTDGQAAKGRAEFAAQHENVTYWFRDQVELEAFTAHPERYLPAHGGWCTLMMSGSARRTPGHPESFVILDDRLMLFWSGDKPENSGMGLANWNSKTKGDPRKARNLIEKADKNWQRFRAGGRQAEIMLYKPSDALTISEGQRADAAEAFVE